MWGGAVGTQVGVIGGDQVLFAVRVLTAAGLAVAGWWQPDGARVSADRYNLQLNIPPQSALDAAAESERAAQPAAQHQVQQHRGQRVEQRICRELSVDHLPVLAEEGVDRH
jgi:hypothetical protein